MSFRRFAALAALSLFTGCAIHPVPEDFTGVRSIDIVNQIRCETRETIRHDIIVWLRKLNDPYSDALALQYETDPASIRTFHYNLFKGAKWVRVRQMIKLFYDTGIAYNFDFDMFEDNNLSGNANFANSMVNPVFALNISAGANRKRENHRTFTVTDTFSGLLTKVPEDYCQGQIVHANYIYPITGRIGVDRLVNDFIELTLFGNLASTADKPGDPGGPPTMGDTLTYTTMITGSVNPSITFTPVTSAFQPTSASLTAVADRSDVHSVAVALAISPTGLTELDPVRIGLFTPARVRAVGPAVAGSGLVVGRRVTGGGTPSERLAVAVIDQIRSREVKVIRNF
jgi:hypothetical protein